MAKPTDKRFAVYKPLRGWPALNQLSPERMDSLAQLQLRPEIVALQTKYETVLQATAAARLSKKIP